MRKLAFYEECEVRGHLLLPFSFGEHDKAFIFIAFDQKYLAEESYVPLVLVKLENG